MTKPTRTDVMSAVQGGAGAPLISQPYGSTGTMGIFVPPGGFASAAQQSPAVQHLMAKASGRVGGRRSAAKRRRKAKTAKRAAPKRRTKRRAKLKKGSAAAKAYMAKIRRKRKK